MAENNETTAITPANLFAQNTGTSLCSIKVEQGNTEQGKLVYNAMNNPTHKVSDFINKKIKVENVLIELVEVVSEDTGEYERAAKCVLISPEGESYFAMSKGIFNSIANAYRAFGDAPWKGGIEFTVKQIQAGKGKMLVLEMV